MDSTLIKKSLPLKVAIADSMPIYRQGIISLLDKQRNFQIVYETDQQPDISYIKQLHKPDVLFIELAILMGSAAPPISSTEKKNCLVVGIVDDRTVGQAPEYLSGYGINFLLHRADTPKMLLKALKSVYRPAVVQKLDSNQKALTEREKQIVKYIALGSSNKIIAEELGISIQSVKNIVSRVLRKLRLTNRLEIAIYSE